MLTTVAIVIVLAGIAFYVIDDMNKPLPRKVQSIAPQPTEPVVETTAPVEAVVRAATPKAKRTTAKKTTKPKTTLANTKTTKRPRKKKEL